MAPEKACLNCKYVSVGKDSGSYYQPPDSGWECHNPNLEVFEVEEANYSLSD
jgi:hypothetical protein